jgi:hypothetical protein
LLGVDPAFDGAVILLDDVVQILAVPLQTLTMVRGAIKRSAVQQSARPELSEAAQSLAIHEREVIRRHDSEETEC